MERPYGPAPMIATSAWKVSMSVVANLPGSSLSWPILGRNTGIWQVGSKGYLRKPTITATAVATSPGIMNEWLSTYLPNLVVPERSKLIAAISEP